MIDMAVKYKWDPDIFQSDGVSASRAKALFTAWLDTSKWGQTFIHAGYRPSMAKWKGYPWEHDFIFNHRDCGLRRGLTSTTTPRSVSVYAFDAPPTSVQLATYEKIWTAESVKLEGQLFFKIVHTRSAMVENLSALTAWLTATRN